MSITRHDIVEATLSWEGTPYQFGQCLKGRGVDCGFLLLGIAKDCGIPVDETGIKGIRRKIIDLDSESAVATIFDFLKMPQKPKDDALPGDIYLARYSEKYEANHVAILCYGGIMIHASRKKIQMRVMREEVTGPFLRRVVACYEFPGITG